MRRNYTKPLENSVSCAAAVSSPKRDETIYETLALFRMYAKRFKPPNGRNYLRNHSALCFVCTRSRLKPPKRDRATYEPLEKLFFVCTRNLLISRESEKTHTTRSPPRVFVRIIALSIEDHFLLFFTERGEEPEISLIRVEGTFFVNSFSRKQKSQLLRSRCGSSFFSKTGVTIT